MRIVLLAPSTIVTACTIALKGAAQSHLSNAGDVPPGSPSAPSPSLLYIDADMSEWMGGIDHSREQENVLGASSTCAPFTYRTWLLFGCAHLSAQLWSFPVTKSGATTNTEVLYTWLKCSFKRKSGFVTVQTKSRDEFAAVFGSGPSLNNMK